VSFVLSQDSFDVLMGHATVELPAVGEPATVTRFELSNHLFMVASETFVFAGPDAVLAFQRYARGQRVSDLDVTCWRIMSTSDIQPAVEGQLPNQGDATMHLMRAL